MQPGAGTGLKNVRQRLEIIYPEKHGLDIEDRGTEFGVHLRLALQ
jgi:LytS/YehU family sensor histidine kinase